jgi:hypothetical protein
VKRKTLLVILFVSAATLVIVASIVLLVDFDSPEMGNAFMEKLGETTDLQWEAERFRLNLIRGLYLEGVTTTGEVAGKQMDARIKNITVKHRILPLLRGEISAR